MALALATTLACGDAGSTRSLTPVIQAEGLWQVRPLRLLVVTPSDMRVGSRNRVWIADTTHNVVFRINPPADEFLRFGFKEEPPTELVQPQRLAVHPNLGIFVYDAGTKQVDLYSQEAAAYLRGFPLEFEPELMAVADQPFGINFGVIEPAGEDLYKLRVIRTGIDGEGRDTILGATQGPPALRELAAPYGDVFVAPSRSGFWVWARAAPDTVFEIAPLDRGRRVVLRPEDRELTGIMADRQKGILWAIVADTAGALFQAYDLTRPDPSGHAPHVASRLLPVDILPFDAGDGIMAGWTRTPGGEFLARAYDMLVDSIPSRSGAEPTDTDQRPGDWSRPGGG